jgi:purine nucleoside phosphorylase
MKKEQLAKLNETQVYIQALTNISPMYGLVLGSGLGELACALDESFTSNTKISHISQYPERQAIKGVYALANYQVCR